MTPEMLYATIRDQLPERSLDSTEEKLVETLTLAVAVAFEAFTPLFEDSVDSSQNNALIMLGVALARANEHDPDCKHHAPLAIGQGPRFVH